ncbi:hypothetical protein CYLTODRAFT_494793 [Cylindrobasidium torrendii FP15055 ss-10]|uniref:Uncharacterized protein n=1 Tax=Cylindrobasidium torrendii FP15055 ss-10 TaxID=1314674 RepID=A0A0D7AY75_9AGAR|nr:hypothetical protein CYLTODRAFT_494793 [Cylindrobasidium torrendii FP15055 ss-10]
MTPFYELRVGKSLEGWLHWRVAAGTVSAEILDSFPHNNVALLLHTPKHGGAPSFVLSEDVVRRVSYRSRDLRMPGRSERLQDFDILSPIVFTNHDRLKEVLDKHTKTSKKKKSVNIPGLGQPGPCYFEQSRVLYRMLKADDTLSRLGISVSIPPGLRVVSLVVNKWAMQLEDLLDAGWTTWDPTSAEMSTTHHRTTEHLSKQPDLRPDLRPELGSTTDLTQAELINRVKGIITPSSTPTVVLIWDLERTKKLLDVHGIDCLPATADLKDILSFSDSSTHHQRDLPSGSRSGGYHDRYSRGPRDPYRRDGYGGRDEHRGGRDSGYRGRDERYAGGGRRYDERNERHRDVSPYRERDQRERDPPAPSRERSWPLLSVIDVRTLAEVAFNVSFGDSETASSLLNYADSRFGIKQERAKVDEEEKKKNPTVLPPFMRNAGNESRLLLDVWMLLAKGNAAPLWKVEWDEEQNLKAQRERDAQLAAAAAAAAAAEVAQAQEDEDSDDDALPTAQPQTAPAPIVPAPVEDGGYLYLDDYSDEEYA